MRIPVHLRQFCFFLVTFIRWMTRKRSPRGCTPPAWRLARTSSASAPRGAYPYFAGGPARGGGLSAGGPARGGSLSAGGPACVLITITIDWHPLWSAARCTLCGRVDVHVVRDGVGSRERVLKDRAPCFAGPRSRRPLPGPCLRPPVPQGRCQYPAAGGPANRSRQEICSW